MRLLVATLLASSLAAPHPREPKKPTGLSHEVRKHGLLYTGAKPMSQTESGDRVTIQGLGLVFSVAPALDTSPKTLEEAKAAREEYAPYLSLKEEQIAGGWNIQFRRTHHGAQIFYVWVRRTLGGKGFDCETTTSSPELAATAERACLSLQKR